MDAAYKQASTAENLETLHQRLAAFDGCSLKQTAKKLCFADGNPEGRVMLVGEAPGQEEDIQGKPFVGPSGRLLDDMLGAIGLGREQVYIANAVPWRPPGNRKPTPKEMEICKPFIARQIELANPDFLILLGNIPVKQLVGMAERITCLRGKWQTYDTGTKRICRLATFHPGYLIRRPSEKPLVQCDMLKLKVALEKGPQADCVRSMPQTNKINSR